jgi:chromosome condensin MukBEF ATPase and DNA-binding subunit MukB
MRTSSDPAKTFLPPCIVVTSIESRALSRLNVAAAAQYDVCDSLDCKDDTKKLVDKNGLYLEVYVHVKEYQSLGLTATTYVEFLESKTTSRFTLP